MKKSLLALAVLGAFAGAASAQSTVTLYGRVDLSVGKPAGAKDKRLTNGSGSRFGVRGVEDLGGGLSAFFNLEHRFEADTGAQSNASRFWTGRSIVGLQGGFGKLTLGREYTTAFLQSQLVADPWGWDTVVSGYYTGPGSSGNAAITGGGIASVRNDSSATYNFIAGGLNVGVQVAEATDALVNRPKKPVNFAVSYGAGPLTAGLGYERTGNEAAATEKWLTLNVAYDLGFVKPGLLIGKGTTAADADRKAFLLTATAPLGAGEARISYGQLKQDFAGVSTKLNKAFAAGYHYSLSKRTTLYADVLNDRGDQFTTSKTGYDIGVKHNF